MYRKKRLILTGGETKIIFKSHFEMAHISVAWLMGQRYGVKHSARSWECKGDQDTTPVLKETSAPSALSGEGDMVKRTHNPGVGCRSCQGRLSCGWYLSQSENTKVMKARTIPPITATRHLGLRYFSAGELCQTTCEEVKMCIPGSQDFINRDSDTRIKMGHKRSCQGGFKCDTGSARRWGWEAGRRLTRQRLCA